MPRLYAKVTGLDGLKAKIQALDQAMQQKTMTEVATVGAEIILGAQRAGAPRETGDLARDLGVQPRKTALLHEGLVQVGPTRKTAWRVRFIEKGVRPHLITTKKRGLAERESGAFFGRTVNHPGVGARPFLKPAVERQRENVFEVMTQKLRQILNRIVGP